MRSFFAPNLEVKGRIFRGLASVMMLLGSVVGFLRMPWLGWLLLASGLFVGYEAVRGWCVMRACGVKTKF